MFIMHVYNAPSPAATASIEIGQAIARQVAIVTPLTSAFKS